MDQIKIIPCAKCGSTSLLKLNDKGGMMAVWADCPCLSKNKILGKLREEGFDIGSQYFKKKAKTENQPAKTDRLLGKFDGLESLESALRSLATRMDIPEQEVEQQIGKLGLPTAYRRLQAAFSGRKQKTNI